MKRKTLPASADDAASVAPFARLSKETESGAPPIAPVRDAFRVAPPAET